MSIYFCKRGGLGTCRTRRMIVRNKYTQWLSSNCSCRLITSTTLLALITVPSSIPISVLIYETVCQKFLHSTDIIASVSPILAKPAIVPSGQGKMGSIKTSPIVRGIETKKSGPLPPDVMNSINGFGSRPHKLSADKKNDIQRTALFHDRWNTVSGLVVGSRDISAENYYRTARGHSKSVRAWK